MSDKKEADASSTAFGSVMHQGAQSIPAVFSNESFVTMLGDVTRIAFGESAAEIPVRYHSAFMMRTIDAVALANIILDLARKNAEPVDPQNG